MMILSSVQAAAYGGVYNVVVDGVKYVASFENDKDSNDKWYTYFVAAYVVSNEYNQYSGDVKIRNTIDVQVSDGSIITVKVEGLDIRAFKNCTGLTSVFIPSNIKYIGEPMDPYGEYSNWDCSLQNPFVGCTNLNKVIVDEENNFFDSRDDCNALIKTETNTLISGCKNTIIPNTATEISKYAFYQNTELSSISIPNSVSRIGEKAFSECSNLENVEFLDGLTNIGCLCFENCKKLTVISLPESVKQIDSRAFDGCISLTDVYCYSKPDLLYSSFYDDGEEWGDVEGWAFDESGKNAILHVCDTDIENFKTDEEWSVFKEIVVIVKITDFNLKYYVDGEEYKTVQYKYDDVITPLDAPIRDGYTFCGWSEIPENMPGKDVKVEGTFTSNEVKESGVIYHVFNERAAVIGNDNAAGDVKIASSVTFNEKSVPVTDIVDFSFKNNTDITSVVIPECVMKIGDEAFYGCKNLITIELGKSVNQIEPRAFAGIDKLTDVICYAEELVPDADRTAFENSYTEDYVTLHVPAKALEKYKEAAPWKNFKEIVAIDGTEETKDEDPAKDEEGDDATEDVITLKDSGKGTWCSENDLDFTDLEDIKAYIASGYDDIKKTIWLTRVYSVPAGTGIMVKGTPGEHKIPYAKVRAYYANMFKGVVGSAEKIEATDGDWTNYYMAGGQFKIVNGSTTINPNRCYLQLPTLVFAGTRSVDVVYEDEIDDKTGIIPSFITNDQEPAVIYNLQGQRVENPKKGLYIKNGKKVIVR